MDPEKSVDPFYQSFHKELKNRKRRDVFEQSSSRDASCSEFEQGDVSSTPRKKKKKTPQEEFVSPSLKATEDLIKTKASRYSYQDEFLTAVEQRAQSQRDSVLSNVKKGKKAAPNRSGIKREPASPSWGATEDLIRTKASSVSERYSFQTEFLNTMDLMPQTNNEVKEEVPSPSSIRTRASSLSGTRSFQDEFLSAMSLTAHNSADDDVEQSLHTSVDLGVMKDSPGAQVSDGSLSSAKKKKKMKSRSEREGTSDSMSTDYSFSMTNPTQMEAILPNFATLHRSNEPEKSGHKKTKKKGTRSDEDLFTDSVDVEINGRGTKKRKQGTQSGESSAVEAHEHRDDNGTSVKKNKKRKKKYSTGCEDESRDAMILNSTVEFEAGEESMLPSADDVNVDQKAVEDNGTRVKKRRKRRKKRHADGENETASDFLTDCTLDETLDSAAELEIFERNEKGDEIERNEELAPGASSLEEERQMSREAEERFLDQGSTSSDMKRKKKKKTRPSSKNEKEQIDDNATSVPKKRKKQKRQHSDLLTDCTLSEATDELESPKKKSKEPRSNDEENETEKNVQSQSLMSDETQISGIVEGQRKAKVKKNKKKKIKLEEKENEIENDEELSSSVDDDLSEESKTMDAPGEIGDHPFGGRSVCFEVNATQERSKADKKSKRLSTTASELKEVFAERSYDEVERKMWKSRQIKREDLSASMWEALEEAKERILLNRDEMQTLLNLHVMLPWPVPPLHLLEHGISGKASERVRDELTASGLTIRRGNYTKAEDERILKNWKKFWTTHDLPEDPSPFVNLGPGGRVLFDASERLKFVRFLAHGLNDRLLCSVYNRFKRLLGQNQKKSGRFTPDEDRQIIEFIKTSSSSKPYADLGLILNRDRLAVEKRCCKLGEHFKGQADKIQWTNAKIQEFLVEFVDVLKVRHVDELKDRKITAKEWKTMGDRLEQSVEKLRCGWFTRIYPKLFIQEKIFSTAQVRSRLVALLIEEGADDWRNVDWAAIAQDLGKEFPGFTGAKLSKMFRHCVRYHVPVEQQKDLKACVECLKSKHGTFKKSKIKRLRVVDNRSNAAES